MTGEEDRDAGEKFRIAQPSPQLGVRREMCAQIDERFFRTAIRRHPRQPGFAQLEHGCASPSSGVKTLGDFGSLGTAAYTQGAAHTGTRRSLAPCVTSIGQRIRWATPAKETPFARSNAEAGPDRPRSQWNAKFV